MSTVNTGKTLQELLDSLHIRKEAIEIHIDKSEYTLLLWADGKELKSYPCVFGPDPVNDKRIEGDGCTPEGEFTIRAAYPHKKWSKFLWLDYPNTESQKKFSEAKQKGEIPADASIGGEIGIHGVPEHENKFIDNRVNWTAGCISVKDEDIDEIYAFVSVGTKVIITK